MNKLLSVGLFALGASGMNLTALLSSETQLSALVSLLKTYSNLTSSLESMSNVTLFAPDNLAISALSSSGALSSASSSSVSALLKYHVLPQMVYSSNITTTPAFVHTDLTNSSYTNVTGGQVVGARTIGSKVFIESGLKMEAEVVKANLNYSGGVVHIIDRVLTIPPNISTTAVDAGLTDCLGALNDTKLLSTLEMSKDITIFAPSNSAFEAVGSALKNLSTKALTSILEYHVINGTVAYSSDLGNASVKSVEGKDLNITVINGAIFVNAARVINSDILLDNGVLHVIDAVLNPNSTMKPKPSVSTGVIEFSSASSASLGSLTSGISTASSTNTALVATTNKVASGYSTHSGIASAVKKTSSSKAMAAHQTGMVGAAALFGGAALVANL